jgi:small subunit ribosomal protein S20
MANIKSVEKRARQSVVRRARNTSVLTSLKTAQKRARKAIGSGDATAAQAEIDNLSSALDKAAKRGIIHPNAANRGKSRIQRARAKAAAPAAA